MSQGHSIEAEAVWFPTAFSCEVRHESVPPPAIGEVRVRAIVSAISHGTEMLVYRGQIPANTTLDLPTLAGDFAFPIKYGYANVGRVIDIGDGVQGFAPGDLVFALHPHQSVFNAPQSVLTLLPPQLDPLLGVFTANTETALNIAHDTPLRLGETVLVIGQGVVGLLVTQLVRRAGATCVLTIDPQEAARARSLLVGADATFAPDASIVEHILHANNGRLADVAIEVSGNAAALQQAIDGVLDEGTVVVASWYGTKPATLALGGRFHRGRITLRSSQVGRLNPATAPRWDYARRLATATQLLDQLTLTPLITQRFPLARAAEAYHLIDQQPAACGQVVLTYTDKPGASDV